MKTIPKLSLFTVLCIIWFVLVIFAMIMVTGCANLQRYDDETLDTFGQITKALIVANTASAPVNPFVLPIGVGLAGVSAMLEALRRKEKSGRKHAEQKLDNNNNSN